MPIKGCYERIIKNCISPCLYGLVTIQIFIGLMVIITSEYFKNLLGRYVPEIEQNEINIKLFLFELFGCNVFLSYIGGLPLLRRLSDSYTNHLSSLLKLWQFFILTASLNGMFGGYMINGSRKFLKRTIEATLFRGIEVYYSDPEWRLIWDGFQYNEQCCGVVDFRDWQSLSWMMNQDEGSKVQSDEDAPSLTPYSCCKKSSVCYGNTNRDKSQIWVELPPSINMTLINEQGCLKIFSDRLDEICVIIFIVVGIVFLLQILILIGMVILMYKKTTPITIDGSDSVEIIDECDRCDDDQEYTFLKKSSKHYILKNCNRKNHVAFADMNSSEDEQETSKLLTEPIN